MVKGELRTPENAAIIIEHLENGESVCEIANHILGCTDAAILKWASTDAEFGKEYARARGLGYLKMADEIVQIADDSGHDARLVDGLIVIDGESVQRARLRVDTRKWLLSKMLPKVYGEKSEVQIKIPEDVDAKTKALVASCQKQGFSAEVTQKIVEDFLASA